MEKTFVFLSPERNCFKVTLDPQLTIAQAKEAIASNLDGLSPKDFKIEFENMHFVEDSKLDQIERIREDVGLYGYTLRIVLINGEEEMLAKYPFKFRFEDNRTQILSFSMNTKVSQIKKEILKDKKNKQLFEFGEKDITIDSIALYFQSENELEDNLQIQYVGVPDGAEIDVKKISRTYQVYMLDGTLMSFIFNKHATVLTLKKEICKIFKNKHTLNNYNFTTNPMNDNNKKSNEKDEEITLTQIQLRRTDAAEGDQLQNDSNLYYERFPSDTKLLLSIKLSSDSSKKTITPPNSTKPSFKKSPPLVSFVQQDQNLQKPRPQKQMTQFVIQENAEVDDFNNEDDFRSIGRKRTYTMVNNASALRKTHVLDGATKEQKKVINLLSRNRSDSKKINRAINSMRIRQDMISVFSAFVFMIKKPNFTGETSRTDSYFKFDKITNIDNNSKNETIEEEGNKKKQPDTPPPPPPFVSEIVPINLPYDSNAEFALNEIRDHLAKEKKMSVRNNQLQLREIESGRILNDPREILRATMVAKPKYEIIINVSFKFIVLDPYLLPANISFGSKSVLALNSSPSSSIKAGSFEEKIRLSKSLSSNASSDQNENNKNKENNNDDDVDDALVKVIKNGKNTEFSKTFNYFPSTRDMLYEIKDDMQKINKDFTNFRFIIRGTPIPAKLDLYVRQDETLFIEVYNLPLALSSSRNTNINTNSDNEEEAQNSPFSKIQQNTQDSINNVDLQKNKKKTNKKKIVDSTNANSDINDTNYDEDENIVYFKFVARDKPHAGKAFTIKGARPDWMVERAKLALARQLDLSSADLRLVFGGKIMNHGLMIKDYYQNGEMAANNPRTPIIINTKYYLNCVIEKINQRRALKGY